MHILTGCATAANIRPPADRLTCAGEPASISLPSIDWSQPVDRIHPIVNAREAATAAYMIALRAAGQDCRADVDWNRDFFAGQR